MLQRHAAELQGCPLPEARPYSEAEADMSPMARSFWAENRRVSNDLLCKELGYTMVHPNFRSGLAQCPERNGSGATGSVRCGLNSGNSCNCIGRSGSMNVSPASCSN